MIATVSMALSALIVSAAVTILIYITAATTDANPAILALAAILGIATAPDH